MAEPAPPAQFLAALARMGLWSGAPRVRSPVDAPLTGGAASDIWRTDLPSGPARVKRTLAKPRAAADRCAPVARNRHESAWMQAVPGATPTPPGQDAPNDAPAMRYLPPDLSPPRKTQLRDGRTESRVAESVADRLGRTHTAAAVAVAVAAAAWPAARACRRQAPRRVHHPRHPARRPPIATAWNKDLSR